jgi:hypothetical protein
MSAEDITKLLCHHANAVEQCLLVATLFGAGDCSVESVECREEISDESQRFKPAGFFLFAVCAAAVVFEICEGSHQASLRIIEFGLQHGGLGRLCGGRSGCGIMLGCRCSGRCGGGHIIETVCL